MRLVDADALKEAMREKFKTVPERCEVNEVINATPTIDAIPVEWLCEKIRYEEKFGGIPFGEYIKVLIWDWHQQEQEAK